MKQLLIYLSIYAMMGCGDGEGDSSAKQPSSDTSEPTFQTFQIEALAESAENGFTELLNETNMRVEVVALTSNETSKRPETGDDEVFYVYRGKGVLTADDIAQEIAVGQAVMAKGSLKTKISTEEEIIVVVVSLKKSGNLSEDLTLYTKAQIESKKSQNANTWNAFLRESNAIFGLYALPQANDGDNSLVHDWDELNIVISGEGQFTMDAETIDVVQGSLVYVPSGTGHFFDQLSADLNIMILWNQ